MGECLMSVLDNQF